MQTQDTIRAIIQRIFTQRAYYKLASGDFERVSFIQTYLTR